MSLTAEQISLYAQLQPVHPGILFARSVLPGLHLPTEKVIERLEISNEEFRNLLSGKTDLTPELANRVGELVGDGADIWLRIQESYNDWCDYSRKTPKPQPM
jgi:addiction module HigA family antidote